MCVRTIAKTCVDVSQEQMPKAHFFEKHSVWFHGMCACFACLTISLSVRPYVHMYVYVHVFTGEGSSALSGHYSISVAMKNVFEAEGRNFSHGDSAISV